MKLARSIVSFSLIFSMSLLSVYALPTSKSLSQNEGDVALQRGYRTGYSDGYMAGYRDSIDKAERNATRHSEYSKADRAYNADYGSVEDYRDGYRQGFEAGYNTGFDKKSFDASIPAGIARRGMIPASYTPPTVEPQSTATIAINTAAETVVPAATQTASIPATTSQADTNQAAIQPTTETPAADNPAPNNGVRKVAYVSNDDPVIIIPKDTEIIVEMNEALDTQRSREGDKFTARVVSPVEIAGATVEGHVDKVTRPGRIKRRSQLLLQFDRIVISDSRWTNFDAIVTEVLPIKGDNVKTVDDEGTAIGKSSLKGDLTKVGIATGTGAGIGLFGGPVGAAVGAGVGAAFGVGAVLIERGKDIKLSQTQQIRIKTSYESQIR